MAQRVSVELVDDLDGSTAEETVTFGLDGRQYEIDLNGKNAAKIRKALDPYLGSARVVKGQVKKRKLGVVPQQRIELPKTEEIKAPLSEVRAWALENGYEVSSRGRLPNSVMEAFAAAQ